MDFSKVKPGDWVLAASGIVLLIASFLTWFTYDIVAKYRARNPNITVDWSAYPGPTEITSNGWDMGFFFGILPVLLGLALVALVVIQRLTTVELPKPGSLNWGQVSLIGGAVVAGLLLLKLLMGQDLSGIDAFEARDEGLPIGMSPSLGFWVALLAAVGLVVGGFLRMREENAAPAGETGTPPVPPPPPPPG